MSLMSFLGTDTRVLSVLSQGSPFFLCLHHDNLLGAVLNPLFLPILAPQGRNPLYEPAVNAVHTDIFTIFQGLMRKHNFPLPPNWTFPDLTTEVIGPENINDLHYLVGVLRDLSLYGISSHHFHEALNFLNAISPVLPGGG